MKVGLVGLGRMGSAIAQRLDAHGSEVVAWDRSEGAMAARRKRGGRLAGSPREVAESSEVVISMITEDIGVRRIFTGADGFLSGEVSGGLFIEMSTLKPATHRDLAVAVKAKGASLVDAPVLGSIPTARDGKLLALLGGEAADVERARAVLAPLTRRVAHIGPNGAGCAMKLAANLGMAVYVQALAEALSLGRSEGIGIDMMLDILGESPLASPLLAGRMAVFKGAPADMTLDVRTIRKDVMSAVATGAANGVGLPAATGALASLSAAVASGWGEKDMAEMPRYYREFMLQNYD